MDFPAFVSCLRCPECQGAFTWKAVDNPSTPIRPRDGRFGVLSCQCSRYPVLADIPIIMHRPLGLHSHWNDGAVHEGVMPDYLVALLDKGRWQEALLEALVFPRRFPFQYRLSARGLFPSRLLKPIGLAQTRATLQRLLFTRRDSLRLADWIGVFFAHRSGNNSYLADYFYYKASTPRFLSAMALVQRLSTSQLPVLDLSCGMGHFVRYLTRRMRATPAMGLDFNFHQLWGARHLIATDGWFICADSGRALPLAEGSLSAITCADAFPYLPDKPMTVTEFDRTAPSGPVIIARTGHLGVGPANPPTGGELTSEQYLTLFGRERTRIFADTMLWKDYLEKRDPLARPDTPTQDLRWEKYLSLVIRPEALGPMPPASEPRPHAIGRLQLNPVYTVTRDDAGGTELQFTFTNAWGAYEDADMAAYVQRWVSLPGGQLREALANPGSAAALDLVERFVLIGEVEAVATGREAAASRTVSDTAGASA